MPNSEKRYEPRYTRDQWFEWAAECGFEIVPTASKWSAGIYAAAFMAAVVLGSFCIVTGMILQAEWGVF